ncbi:nitroreductase family protein [Corticimicrobacter populi]|uniref:Putative NAD(P)H nitroreductase n=1 Tax=Corticimicrobacter populi TaxID=2175229 RepID=A0A2V1K7G7_9BURK|nr:nitroreductase [Corticimicrobacter populi]PWF25467.1 nitroreductase [Corticimicrobacter populi]
MTTDVLDTLASRRSFKLVTGPGPSQDELDRILQTAMSAPDHGALRPWRFRLIRGGAIARLADMAIQAMKDSVQYQVSSEKEAAIRQWLGDVPVVLAVACHLDHRNDRIPQWEREVATGAAVTNILNAAHALGYGAFWSTGLGAGLDTVQEALGFDPLDHRFMGYVVIGTPAVQPSLQPRESIAGHVREWHAPETV